MKPAHYSCVPWNHGCLDSTWQFSRGISPWPSFTTFPLLQSLFFAFLTPPDAQNARNDAGDIECISMLLLSTDLQDFRDIGLQLRDNQFWLSLIIVVAFEYHSNMYTTSYNTVETTHSANQMCEDLDTQIGIYLYSW